MALTEIKEDTSQPCPRTCRPSRSAACVGVGIILIGVGALMILLWSGVFAYILTQILELSPGSETYKSWLEPEVPSYIDFYFFNWTNPQDITDPEKKMHFTEMGPYRFLEKRHKLDIEINNSNNTISYKQARYWFFDAENSRGSLGDYLTTVDVISLSAAYIKRDANFFVTFPLSQIINTRALHVNHTVSEMLFEGYEDILLTLSAANNMGSKASAYDKYGLFYKRNGSIEYDGVYNIGTGVGDLSEAAAVKRWNFDNTTDFFPGHCGEVKGTTGERFPANSIKGEPIGIFSNSLCRSVSLPYDGEDVVEDIPVYRYKGGSVFFDNGTLDPDNACYCGGECVPSGVLNISSCHEGAPIFTSFPHFQHADPYYLERIEGLRPDPKKHDFYISVEPQTGIPIDVAARLQINILIQPYSWIRTFSQLPRVFFPMMWFEQSAKITPDLATSLRLLLMVGPFGQIAAIVFLALGSGMLATVLLWHLRERRTRRKSEKVNSYSMAGYSG